MSSIDFSDISKWYHERVGELRAEAMLLRSQRVQNERNIARAKKRRRAKRKRDKGKRVHEYKPHAMIRRSHTTEALEGEPVRLNNTIRFHISNNYGVSRCGRCGEVKEAKYFSLTDSRHGSVVAPNCIRCQLMQGYDADPLKWFARYVVSEAKSRSAGKPFDLDAEWVCDRFTDLAGCCELCGRDMTVIKQDYREGREGHRSFMRNPTNLSLDQRVPGAGYTKENVQLVNLQCNLAKLDLPQSEFLEMCRAVAARFPGERPLRSSPRLLQQRQRRAPASTRSCCQSE